jgi:hypothetical protein
VRVDFRKGRILMRREHDLSESALASIGDVFSVNKKAEFAEDFFAEGQRSRQNE